MPQNSVRRIGYLTPDSADYERLCRSFSIPNDARWLGNFMGAIEVLTHEENWRQYGLMTPEEAAAVAQQIFDDGFYGTGSCNDVPAPYWQDVNGDDLAAAASPETQAWYGRIHHSDPTFEPDLADFVFSAFLVSIGVPNSAVQFIVNLRHASIAYRKGQHGAILRVFLDGVEQPETIDTYSATDDVGQRVYDIIADGTVLWVEHTGTHNASATPDESGQYRMDLVRKNLADGVNMFQLRQNPDNSCQLQQSLDGGETWTLAFDYSVCIPPATQTILETVINNNTWVNPSAPTTTFISQADYDDTQKDNGYQALCYAVGALVESMASAAYQAKQGDLTAETLVSIGLGIASAILLAFDILSFGVLTPVCLAIAGAALAAFAAIDALSAGVWLDTDNLQALKCLALGNLSNSTVTLANFQQAFDGADCLTADQQSMAEIFASMLANVGTATELYDNYLNTIGNANAAAQAGVLGASCVCDGATWCHDIFPSNARGMVVLSDEQWGDMYALALYCAGTINTGSDRWDMQDGCLTGDNPCASLVANFFIPAGSTLTAIGYGYSGGSGAKLGGTSLNGSLSQGTGSGWPPSYSGGVSLSVTGSVEFKCYIGNNTGNNPDGYITHIHLEGTGVNPFGGCSNC